MNSASDYVRHSKWRLLNSRRQDELRRRKLDLENELANTATGSGDTSTRNSFVDYEWSSPSKNSESYWVEDSYDKGTVVVLRNRDPHRTVIYDFHKFIIFFDPLYPQN